MRAKWSLLVGSASAILVSCSAIVAVHNSKAQDEAYGWTTHTMQVMMKAHELALAISDTERAAAYSVAPVDSRPDKVSLERARDARKHLAELRAMTMDNPEQQRRWEAVNRMLMEQQTDYIRAITTRSHNAGEAAIRRARGAQEASIMMIEAAIDTENKLLVERRENLRQAENNMTATLAFVALLALALLVFAIRGLVIGSRAARLRAIAEAKEIEIEERMVVEADLKDALDHQKLLLDELNHRVKNSLVTVQSIAKQTKNSAVVKLRLSNDTLAMVNQYYCAFEDRLLSLSATHDLLVKGSWAGVSLYESLEAALRPLVPQNRVAIGGPDINLSPNAAVTLNMIFHELTTNAIKYGSMSNETGTITVSWEIKGETLELDWREEGGPLVTPPTGKGFGTTLIERGIGRELKGTHILDYRPEGVCFTFIMPMSAHISIP